MASILFILFQKKNLSVIENSDCILANCWKAFTGESCEWNLSCGKGAIHLVVVYKWSLLIVKMFSKDLNHF